MKSDVDVIVSKLPPPGKMGPAEEADDEEYNAEEAAALDVAKALGIDPASVDVPALCSALRDFNATTSTPEE